MPNRIQLRRTKGWRKPAGCVSVGRGSRWGNPFKLDGAIDVRYVRADLREVASAQKPEPRTQSDAVAGFTLALLRGDLSFTLDDIKRELRGKDLACWCKPGDQCHADALLWYANE